MSTMPAGGGGRNIDVVVAFKVNEASAQQAAKSVQDTVRPMEQAGRAAQATAGSFSFLGQQMDIQRIVGWSIAWNLVYRALNIVESLASEMTVGALARLEEFQKRQIMLAAELVNLDPSLPWSKAAGAAKQYLTALEGLEGGFLGTREELAGILDVTLRFFGAVDVQTPRGQQQFLALANAIEGARFGLGGMGSAFREIAALSQGVLRPNSQLLLQLQQIDPMIVRHVQEWKAAGTVYENVTRLLTGQQGISAAYFNTLEGQIKRFGAAWNVMLRENVEGTGGLVTQIIRMGAAFLEFDNNLRRSGAERRARMENFLLGGRAVGPFGRTEEFDPLVVARRQQAAAEQYITAYRETEGAAAALAHQFKIGQLTSTEYGAALKILAQDALIQLGMALAGREKNLDQYAKRAETARIASEQFMFAQKKLAEEMSRFQQFAVPETMMRSQMGATESIFRRGDILPQLLRIQQAQLSDLNLRRSLAKATEEQFRIDKEILQVRQAIITTEHEITQNAKEQRRIVIEARAAMLQALRDEFTARLTLLSLQETEELRRVAGNEQAITAVRRRYAAERQRDLENFAQTELQHLVDLRERMKSAQASFAEAQMRPFQLRSSMLRGTSELQLSGLMAPGGSETPQQAAERFRRIREIQSQMFGGLTTGLGEELARAASPAQRLRIGEQMIQLILEQARAQADLNRQEREASLAGRDRQLDIEIRMLTRKLTLLGQIGTSTQEIQTVEKALQQAQERRGLRGEGREELQQELALSLRGLQRPGISLDEWNQLRAHITAVRQAISDLDSAQVKQEDNAASAASAIRKAYDTIVRPALSQLQQEAQFAAERAQQEYGRLFDYLKGRLPELVTFFRQTGDAAGAAFVDAALQHFRRVFAPPAGGGQLMPLPDRSDQRSGNVIYMNGVDLTGISDSAKQELIAAVMGIAGDHQIQTERRYGLTAAVA